MRPLAAASLVALAALARADRVPGSPFPVVSAAGLNASTALLLLDPSGLSPDDALTLASLQGVLSRGAPTLYRAAPGSDYDLWRRELSLVWSVAFDTSLGGDVWAAVARFARNVSGYVVANLTDGSVNAAVALAAVNGSLVVTAANAARAAAAGLALVADATGRQLPWVLATLGTGAFSDRVTLIQSPAKTGMSDFAIAARALPWWVADANASSGPAPAVWAALSPPFAALGWGPDEFGTVWAASFAGGGVVASDWATNLDVLSSFDVPAFPPLPPPPPPPAPPAARHTCAFLLSDGDNVQWMLGGFATGAPYWGSPDRGAVPMGWTVSAALADLAPAALHYLHRTATPQDDLVMALSGAAYLYTDVAEAGGHLAGSAALALAYARKAGMSTANVMTGGAALSPDAVDAMLPVGGPLRALFHYQYSDYSGDHGAISFSRAAGLPVIGARFMLWGDGTQGADFKNVGQAALALALASRDPTSAAGYSLVVVHAWSHNVTDARSVVELVDKLAPGGVDFVTPAQLAQRVAANVKRQA